MKNLLYLGLAAILAACTPTLNLTPAHERIIKPKLTIPSPRHLPPPQPSRPDLERAIAYMRHHCPKHNLKHSTTYHCELPGKTIGSIYFTSREVSFTINTNHSGHRIFSLSVKGNFEVDDHKGFATMTDGSYSDFNPEAHYFDNFQAPLDGRIDEMVFPFPPSDEPAVLYQGRAPRIPPSDMAITLYRASIYELRDKHTVERIIRLPLLSLFPVYPSNIHHSVH
ncbi:hypothetical protein ACFL0V_05250 [Nanoarchaeota archaeon]